MSLSDGLFFASMALTLGPLAVGFVWLTFRVWRDGNRWTVIFVLWLLLSVSLSVASVVSRSAGG